MQFSCLLFYKCILNKNQWLLVVVAVMHTPAACFDCNVTNVLFTYHESLYPTQICSNRNARESERERTIIWNEWCWCAFILLFLFVYVCMCTCVIFIYLWSHNNIYLCRIYGVNDVQYNIICLMFSYSNEEEKKNIHRDLTII